MKLILIKLNYQITEVLYTALNSPCLIFDL